MNSMDTKELIEYITKEVMKRIQNTNTDKLNERKDKILTVDISIENVLEKVKEDFYIDHLEDLNEDVVVDSYKYILIGSMTNKELVNIALGLPNDKISSIIIDFILRGKRVYVLNEGIKYHKYKDSSNIPFYNMMKSYEERLETFGINFVNEKEISGLFADNMRAKESVDENVDKNNQYVIKEKIVTESLIRQIHQGGYTEVVTNKATIITPLAKDYIRTNGIGIFTK